MASRVCAFGVFDRSQVPCRDLDWGIIAGMFPVVVCTFVGSVGACVDIGWIGVGVEYFSSSLRRINDLPWPSISGFWSFGSL